MTSPSADETVNHPTAQAPERSTAAFSEVPVDWQSGLYISERGAKIAIAIVTVMPGEDIAGLQDYLQRVRQKALGHQLLDVDSLATYARKLNEGET